MNNRHIFSLPALIGLLITLSAASSCNKSSDTETFESPANLTVTGFSLAADIHNPGLDSAYFSIDLEHGVIFNADSLRKGIKVNKVIPKITFGSTVSEAVIVMNGGTTREGEVDYQKNPTDSIDFTGDVTLRLKAADGTISTSYRIKVNVHKEDPDTLIWTDIESRKIPSRLPAPKAIRTVERDGNVLCLIEESDGSLTKATAASFESMNWTSEAISLPFTPNVRTLNMTEDHAWILATDGTLRKGTPTLDAWENTGETWEVMIGAYTESVIGIRNDNGRRVFAQYPMDNLVIKEIPEDFPLTGISNMVTLRNKWTLSPVAFFTGGTDATGHNSDITWAFDGSEWIKLCEGGIPALQGASIIPYYNYRRSADGKTMNEYNVWMLLGGRKSDGSLNRTVYVSYDNGVNWAKGVSSLQLPQQIPAMMDCDALVGDIQLKGNLSDGWTRSDSPQRVNFWTSGDYVIWECPYIYLFGGVLPDGSLSTTIWRGVLNRLTFVPII